MFTEVEFCIYRHDKISDGVKLQRYMCATILFQFFKNYTNDFYLDLASGYTGVYECF